MRKTGVSISGPTYQRLRDACDAAGIPVAVIVESLVNQYLGSLEATHGQDGRSLDHEEREP